MLTAERTQSTEAHQPEPIAATCPSAVAWIDDHGATVALMDRDGHVSTCAITRGSSARPSYLALIVRVIGDRERVVILGPNAARLALEREYVAIFKRPERLVDVEPAGPMIESDLVRRLRELAA